MKFKNISLYLSATIFFMVGILQFLRFQMGLSVSIGHGHEFPLEVSFYLAIAALVLGLWMLIAALIKGGN